MNTLPEIEVGDIVVDMAQLKSLVYKDFGMGLYQITNWAGVFWMEDLALKDGELPYPFVVVRSHHPVTGDRIERHRKEGYGHVR